MNAPIFKQTISGRAFPLHDPAPSDVDLYVDVAESLARLCRFDGHVPGGLYSVAQHCVVGAEAILAEVGDARLAAAFLLHDAHEAYIGDISTPAAAYLAAVAAETDLVGIGFLRQQIEVAKRRLDTVIFRAAGIPCPDNTIWRGVKEWDERMLAAERRQLLATCPHPIWPSSTIEAKPIRMRGKLTCWPIATSADKWREMLDMLCPQAARAA